MSSSSDRCPWCDEPLGPSGDPVTVSADRYPFPGERLHRDCADEWRSFIERAQRLAEAGTRHSLIVAPLEKGWSIDTDAQPAESRDGF